MLKSNLKNFKLYLKDEYRDEVTRHYIAKNNMAGAIDKGIIFLYEDLLSPPDWIEYLKAISEKNTFPVKPKIVNRAVVFFRIKGAERRTFAICFGNGSTLLDMDYIVQDFGFKVSKSLLVIEELTSIDSTSIDRRMFNTKKQSAAFLMPEKLLEYGTQNIVKTVYGVYKESNEKFSLGGTDSLSFKGNIDLVNDLEKWLRQFADLYSQGQDKLGIADDLLPVDKTLKRILDIKLANKILDIINQSKITRSHTTSLKISPSVTFDLTNFNGFFINGLGYKNSNVTSDFHIDEVSFFERLKRQLKPSQKNEESLLRKIRTDTIHRKIEGENELKLVCSIYKAINFEVTLNTNKYILVAGIWYEIDKEFYSVLKKEIDAIKEPDTTNGLNFIDFDSSIHYQMKNVKGKLERHASEGKYNEDFAKNNHILMLDRKDYTVDTKTMKRYNFKTGSSIEICDALYFDKNKIQFIHVKRHSGAAGTSHLLTQSLVSAHAFINDNEAVVKHINKKIKDFNSENPAQPLEELEYVNQQKEVILAIIDEKEKIKKAGKNSKMLSLLEMISLLANVKNLEFSGFKCYLKFIPGDKK